MIETHGDEARAAVAALLDEANYRTLDTRGQPRGAELADHVCAVPR